MDLLDQDWFDLWRCQHHVRSATHVSWCFILLIVCVCVCVLEGNSMHNVCRNHVIISSKYCAVSTVYSFDTIECICEQKIVP